MLELARELDFPFVQLQQQAAIAEAIERHNSARNLPHLTIIMKKGEEIMSDALNTLMGMDDIGLFFQMLNDLQEKYRREEAAKLKK
mmetsp:Transcript_1864/g.2640  ORF Transcript_1864/g.2640 Transcript_1864/m.2640 type:complete len:86 (+) Transcript_1864:324-581(+)